MGNGVTIIVGAGAVLDFDHKGIFPFVKNITDEVFKQSIQKVGGGERPLLRELNDYIIAQLNKVGRPEVNRYNPPQLNFENLLHIIEMCIAHENQRGASIIAHLLGQILFSEASVNIFACSTTFTSPSLGCGQ